MSAEENKPELQKEGSPSTLSKPGLRLGASWISSAARHIQSEFLNSLGEGELRALPFLFEFWAMEHQLPPEGNWRSWVIMGGRGAGKTRAGAEWVRSIVEGPMPLDKGRCRRIALVGETIEQIREVMIFGDSGILACSPEDRRPDWEATRKRLVWPNGAVATVHSAHDPEGLRGPQFDGAWVDEYGCAAIDKGTNQPNKFLDLKSSESSLPRYSSGARDELMQMQYLRAMIDYWAQPENNPDGIEYDGKMVDMTRAFVWAWDVRPYPFFPNNRDLWSDGKNYARGHWINGRVSSRSLASVVGEICRRSGLEHYDTNGLFGYVRGYSVEQVADARASMQPLMLRFGFDAIERAGLLTFRMRDGLDAATLDPERLAVNSELDGITVQSREAEAEIAGRVRLRFVQADANFDVISEEAVLSDEATHAVSASEVNMALTRTEGRQVVERWLTEARVARESLRLALPLSQIALGAGDIIELPGEQDEGPGLYRIDRVEQADMQLLEAVRIEPEVYDPAPMDDELVQLRPFTPPVPVEPYFLDLPMLTGDEVPHAPHIAATAQPWPGSVAVFQSQTDANYALSTVLPARSVIGRTQSPMQAACPGLTDHGVALEVKLTSGTLESVEMDALLGGANLAAIGDGSPDNWEVFQFAEADLIAPKTYALRTRLRGQAGSDGLVPEVWPAGSRFVLLNGIPRQIDLRRNLRGVLQHFRIGPARRSYDDPSYRYFERTFAGNGLRPYAPCHLKAEKFPAGGVEFKWIRRTRVDGDPWNLTEVPLGEDAETYMVRILKNGIVVREATLSEPSWFYSIAAQTDDEITAPFEINVAQVSASFGPGLSARLVVAA